MVTFRLHDLMDWDTSMVWYTLYTLSVDFIEKLIVSRAVHINAMNAGRCIMQFQNKNNGKNKNEVKIQSNVLSVQYAVCGADNTFAKEIDMKLLNAFKKKKNTYKTN